MSGPPGWRSALEVLVALGQLTINPVPEISDSVSSIQSAPDLLIRVDKSVQLDVQVLILSIKHSNMLLQGVYFSSEVPISIAHGLVTEPDIVQFSPGQSNLFFLIPTLGFQVIGRLGEISSFALLDIETSLERQSFLSHAVSLSLKLVLVGEGTGVFFF